MSCATSRILIVRLDGVGDAAVCAPLIAALRGAGHRLGIVLSTRNAELFAADVFDERYALERIPWPAHGSTPASYASARAAIRVAGYDAAMIVSEEPEAYALARQGGIRRRIGFWNGIEKPFKSLWTRTQLSHAVYRPASRRGQAHEAEVVFGLARGWTALVTPPRDPAVLRPLFTSAAAPERGDGAVTLQLTPKWAQVGVAPRDLVELVARLYAEGGPVRLCADAREAGYAAPVAAAAGLELETFSGLRPWVSALGAARVVVTPDTGASHVAGMLGVAVVAVFPPADSARQIARWSPWAAPYRAVAFQPGSTGIAASLVNSVRAVETNPA